jgi:ParB family chromosome partitioning protein
MWLNVPETQAGVRPETPARHIALAGTVGRRRRTVLTVLPITALEANPEQPRKHFAEEKLAELASSIRTRGLLQPVVVRRRAEGGFQLLAGERRFRAAQLAGLDRVPALIREGDDPLEIALIENVQREDLSPLEEAEALALLIERHGYSHREVADLLGKSRPYVSNTLALNRLPEPVKADLHREGHGLSREVLMGIAREETAESALALWQRVRLDAMSVRRFRAERSGDEPTATARPVSRDVVLAARRLGRAIKRLTEAELPQGEDAASMLRTLRRTERLIAQQIAALTASS